MSSSTPYDEDVRPITTPDTSGTVRISVVMNVYNGERFVAEAIESVLAQTFTDFEFIIINDGSTDHTAEILADYASRDKRIIIANQPNQGVSTSLNRALSLARAPLVAHIDGDDRALPHWLERQLDFLESHPEASVVASYALFIDSKGRYLGVAGNPIDVAKGVIEKNPRHFLEVIHSTVLMKKADIQQVGGYRMPYLLTDRDLWGRVVTSGKTIVCNPEYLVEYRLHGRSLTLGISPHEHLEKGIDVNVRRRLCGEPELSADDLKRLFDSRSWPQIVIDRYERTALRSFVNASRAYADRRWSAFLIFLIVAILLRPWYVPIRIIRKRFLSHPTGT